MAKLPQGRVSPVGKRAASELAEAQATRRLLPAENEKYALRGTSGYPSDDNRYVTEDDVTHVLIDGSRNFTGVEKFEAGLVVPKTSGLGIKVDTDNPTFGWRDLLGEVTIRSPAVFIDPTLAVYRGGLRQYQFTVNDEIQNTFHIPHDYVLGTDIHLHFHWSHIATTVTGGSVTWGTEVSYAKGHNQAAFSAPITATVQQNASTTQYQHMLAEGQLSAASPSASQIDTDNLEPDGVILIRTYLSINGITVSGGAVPEPFLHYVDIHYQSTGVTGTKSKVPSFYV